MCALRCQRLEGGGASDVHPGSGDSEYSLGAWVQQTCALPVVLVCNGGRTECVPNVHRM